MSEHQVKLVDAIDEGRIVRVTEDFARREGLPILRRPKIEEIEEKKALNLAGRERKEFFRMDDFRRPLKRGNNVLNSLKDNFHWIIAGKRKQMNLSRKQLSIALNEREADLKMIENGVLPVEDFVLINKIEQFFGTNLRKDNQDFSKRMSNLIGEVKEKSGESKGVLEGKKAETAKSIYGDDIEIID